MHALAHRLGAMRHAGPLLSVLVCTTPKNWQQQQGARSPRCHQLLLMEGSSCRVLPLLKCQAHRVQHRPAALPVAQLQHQGLIQALEPTVMRECSSACRAPCVACVRQGGRAWRCTHCWRLLKQMMQAAKLLQKAQGWRLSLGLRSLLSRALPLPARQHSSSSSMKMGSPACALRHWWPRACCVAAWRAAYLPSAADG